MERYGIIRQFNTAHFQVIVSAEFEPDPDFSFEGGAEAQEKVEAGEWVCFAAHVEVIHDQLGKVGEDWLGNCIHENIEDFEDHRECAAETRRLRKETGRDVICGSYFSDMIHEAIKEARTNIDVSKQVYIRY